LFAAEVGYYDLHLEGSIYCSMDSGTTWNPTGAPQLEWRALACSADGTHVVAGPGESLSFNAAPIFQSGDAGTNWIENDSVSGCWTGLASSADGCRLVALEYGGIWTSADSGNTWGSNIAPSALLVSVASSADGNKLAAVTDDGGNGYIYRSETAPCPRISLSGAGNGLTVNCIVPSASFVLQQNPDLAPGHWTNVAGTPELSPADLTYRWTLPGNEACGFYRLVQGPQ
jgi:hypothetical protein